MDALDPASGRPLPPDAIQRVLFVADAVHVYAIPPLASMRGHSAAAWTADAARHIFTGRLRVLETSAPEPRPALRVDVVLEDAAAAAAAATPQLFAAAAYTHAAVVEPVVDSSRFFALSVGDGHGRKAVLGIGFEDRSDAFDLAVALQEARRALGLDARPAAAAAAAAAADKAKDAAARDYSLKDGETITVSLASKRPSQQHAPGSPALEPFGPAAPSSRPGDAFALPPPPSADDVKRKRRSLRNLGFDDGQFGEFA